MLSCKWSNLLYLQHFYICIAWLWKYLQVENCTPFKLYKISAWYLYINSKEFITFRIHEKVFWSSLQDTYAICKQAVLYTKLLLLAFYRFYKKIRGRTFSRWTNFVVMWFTVSTTCSAGNIVEDNLIHWNQKKSKYNISLRFLRKLIILLSRKAYDLVRLAVHKNIIKVLFLQMAFL